MLDFLDVVLRFILMPVLFLGCLRVLPYMFKDIYKMYRELWPKKEKIKRKRELHTVYYADSLFEKA